VPFTVLRVPAVTRTVEHELTKRERRAYDAAVEALQGEGCRAGGKRLASTAADDYPMCQQSLYGDWRLITVYRQNRSIVIVALRRHAKSKSAATALATSFPGLSVTGRRRSEQPPCCEDPTAPPTLGAELEALLFDLFGL
jgi:hypothetical protein